MASVTLKGNPIDVAGTFPEVGQVPYGTRVDNVPFAHVEDFDEVVLGPGRKPLAEFGHQLVSVHVSSSPTR